MKRKLTQILVVSLFLVICFSPLITHALYGSNDCQLNAAGVAVCTPPTLGDLQTMLVSLIGMAYALIGVLFMGILIFNGAIYLIGYIEDSKYILGASIEDAQKRMTQWLIGFLMVIISYPLINTFMKGIVGTSSCYDKLNNPTVQFIFPSVCVKQATITGTPSGITPTNSPSGVTVPPGTITRRNAIPNYLWQPMDDSCKNDVCINGTELLIGSGINYDVYKVKNVYIGYTIPGGTRSFDSYHNVICDCLVQNGLVMYGTTTMANIPTPTLTATIPQKDQLSCLNYQTSSGGSSNSICVNSCSGNSAYQSFNVGTNLQAKTLWCECGSKTCFAVTTP